MDEHEYSMAICALEDVLRKLKAKRPDAALFQEIYTMSQPGIDPDKAISICVEIEATKPFTPK